MFWSRKGTPSQPTLSPTPPITMAPKGFDPLDAFRENFAVAGTIALDACPVCGSRETGRLWQLPQTRLGVPTYLNAPGSRFHDLYLDYLPLLKVPQEIFVFDICRHCHSIFRNPRDDDHVSYINDTSKIAAFQQQGTVSFESIAALCAKRFPRDTKVVVDAACGSGQVLALLRQRHPELKLLGLELSRPSVAFIQSLGIDAVGVDLDLEDLTAVLAPGSIDFILFYEAFEHVRSPLTVLRKLVQALRPGGRLHFTAQYYGPKNELQVRVGEPIYIDRHGLDWIVSQLDVDVHHLAADIKFRVTLQKR